MIVQVFIALLPHTDVVATSHRQATFATFDEAPEQVAAGTRPIHFPGALSIATQLELRFGKDLWADHRRGLTPDPLGLWAVVTPGCQRGQLGFGFLAILRDARLPIVIAGLPSIDLIRQDMPDRRGLPDLVMPRRGGELGLIEAFRHLPAPQLLFDQQAINASHDLRLLQVDHHLRQTPVALRDIAIPIAAIGPGQTFSPPGFLQATPPGALEDLGAFIFGDHPLHLGQQFALRRIAEGVLEEN
jgi:hypothetical protein